MDIAVYIADIIKTELDIAPERVAIYGTNFQAPNDNELYVVVAVRGQRILGSSNKFDETTLEEVKSISSFVNIDIEITSKNDDALLRKEEVIMGLTSVYSVQTQEKENFKLFRVGDIIDLTFIEGASSLYRFRIPIVATQVDTKRTVITDYFDKRRETELYNQRG